MGWKRKKRGSDRWSGRTEFLLSNGYEIDRAKCCYQNRTWERYTFQSVLQKLIRSHFSGDEQAIFLAMADNDFQDGTSHLRTVGLVASLGSLLCDVPEEQNAWKKKMLSTVHGVDFPEDFDQLPEEEKTRRLDGAIKALKEFD